MNEKEYVLSLFTKSKPSNRSIHCLMYIASKIAIFTGSLVWTNK